MRKFLLLTSILFLTAFSCAKEEEQEKSFAQEKIFFKAWVAQRQSTAKEILKDSLYLLSYKTTNGESVDEKNYVFYHLTEKNLDGTIRQSSSREIHKQLGTENPSKHYFPLLFKRDDKIINRINLLQILLKSMKVGETKTVAIAAGTDQVHFLNSILELTVVEAFKDVKNYEDAKISAFLQNNKLGLSTANKQEIEILVGNKKEKRVIYSKFEEREPGGKKVSKDTSFQVHYIGRFLDGKVFDTSILDTAKFYGLTHLASSKPSTIAITTENNEKHVTFDRNRAITGFTKAFDNEKFTNKTGKITILFDSSLAYGEGTKTIPAFTPLIFEIEIIKEEKKDKKK